MTPRPLDAMAETAWQRLLSAVPARAGARLASASLALVLIALTICALWGALTTRDSATHATRASMLSDAYAQARAAVADEESLERKYRLEPSPEVAARYRAAADSLVSSLEAARAADDPAAGAKIAGVLETHRRYLDSMARLFAAVDAHDSALVLAIDRDETEPLFDSIESQVTEWAAAHHAAALAALADLDRSVSLVVSVTPVVFAGGLVLLACFWAIFSALQRRLADASQREAQNEIERILSHAERDAALAASRAKSVFLATMSHELRTPLTAILGYCELVRLRTLQLGDLDLLHDVDSIGTSGKHLLALINDILDLTKIESGKMELEVGDVCVRELVDEVAGATGPLAERNGNRLTVSVADTVGLIRTDGTKLRQVLLNLLNNAAKFTHGGAIALRVEPAPSEGPVAAAVRFSVSDTGIGISEAQLAHVFQPFTQADASTTRKYGGTGLGLALCQQLCGLLEGQISVTSAPGAGSTFVVTLPAAISA